MDKSEPSKTGVRCPEELDTKAPASDTASDTGIRITGIKALAAALGIARSTLYLWLEMPDNPGKEAAGNYDVVKWLAFARTIGSKTDAGKTEDKAVLQAEEMRLKNQILRERIERGNGEWIRREQVDADVFAMAAAVKGVLYTKFRDVVELYTDDPRANAIVNRNALDEALSALSDPLPCQERE